MPEVKVSGIPYTINVTPNFNGIQESIDWYEAHVAALQLENDYLRGRVRRLEEENKWLEEINARIQQGGL